MRKGAMKGGFGRGSLAECMGRSRSTHRLRVGRDVSCQGPLHVIECDILVTKVTECEVLVTKVNFILEK